MAACAVLAMSGLSPASSSAQAGPTLTPQEAESQEMGLSLASFCNPARHRRMGETESVIQRDHDALVGTASFLRSAEGTFLVLEGYDESLEGHCLVLGWFGGDLEPGRYPVRRLTMSALEAEVGGDDRSFYAMAAIRTADEGSMLVTESGALEVVSMPPGGITGIFDLSGFVIEGTARTDSVFWSGSFRGQEGS
jgi:hypothetical protein